MEKWFKDMLKRNLESAKEQHANPPNPEEMVLKNPDNYSPRTIKIAKDIIKNKGVSNANRR